MCGLFGWQLNRPEPKIAIAAGLMAYFMDLRGKDSWGFYANDFSKLVKGLGKFSQNYPVAYLSDSQVVIAHCRYATTGAVKEENSHPYHIKNIIGAHNGVVQNHLDLNKKYNRDFQVDSMHIFAHLAENKPMDELYSYGAITWLDTKQPNIINLCRYHTGVLTVHQLHEDDDRKHRGEPFGTIWASTQEAIDNATIAAGFNSINMKIDPQRIYYVQNGKVFDSHKDITIKDTVSQTAWNEQWGPYKGPKKSSASTNTTIALADDPKLLVKTHFMNTNQRGKCGGCGTFTVTRYNPSIQSQLCYLCYIELESPSHQDELVTRARRNYDAHCLALLMDEDPTTYTHTNTEVPL